MEENKNEELQSRREFFKKAAKTALPILAAVTLGPTLLTGCNEGYDEWAPQGSGGVGSASGDPNAAQTSTDCNGDCKGKCKGSCTGTCNTGCSVTCYKECTSCKGSCKSSCTKLCKDNCNNVCKGTGKKR